MPTMCNNANNINNANNANNVNYANNDLLGIVFESSIYKLDNNWNFR